MWMVKNIESPICHLTQNKIFWKTEKKSQTTLFGEFEFVEITNTNELGLGIINILFYNLLTFW